MGKETIELMDDILEKYWKEHLINLALTYSPLTPRTKEFIFLAMEEYKNKCKEENKT